MIPTLNEAENLPHVLPCILRDVHGVSLVDGHSTDGTPELAAHIRPGVRVITQRGRGKGDALRRGFEAATGDIIGMLDADGSTVPAETPRFVLTLLAGAAFAKGVRFLRGGGTAGMLVHRRLGHDACMQRVRVFFSGRYTDLCYGYNAFWRSVMPRLHLDTDGFEIEALMKVRVLVSGLNVVEAPSFAAKRVYGEGHLTTVPHGWRMSKTIWAERRERRLQSRDARAEQPLVNTAIVAPAGNRHVACGAFIDAVATELDLAPGLVS